MVSHIDNEIRRSRQLFQNPYAYLDGEGAYSAVSGEQAEDVHESRRILENQYAYLDERGGYSEWLEFRGKACAPVTLVDHTFLLNGQPKGKPFSKRKIKDIARRLHIELWRRRKEIFPARKEIDSLDILDPSIALKSIGYSMQLTESLGQYSDARGLFEVAGVLDNANSSVQISRRLPSEVRNFTAAHELGHAILHMESELHRDRAVDGTGGISRDAKETEADIFAAYFLLPEKPIRKAFEQRFLTQYFALNDETAFALTSKTLDWFQNRCRTLRDLARMLAGAEHYNGIHFHSMANQFHVSIEAMAIRLEELDLIQR
ncbi:MAG TPA: ImmA/IrrE family metallo-endopeptidase [Burkholderiales bacterium]|nr:ImmA/IrrE family metallo-endopeptidase [Burkholderiales bacterium]